MVAFVFIPLTFATSFFGMNVQQLGTGSTDIGFFVLTAVAAECLSMCLAYGLRPWDRAVTRRKERIARKYSVNVNNISFLDTIRLTDFGMRLLQLDPSHSSETLHGTIIVWPRSQIRNFIAWAMSFREKRHRDEATPDRKSRELGPIA